MAWQNEAACRPMNPADIDPHAAEGFFAFDEETRLIEAAKQVCEHCPVRAACLTWALTNGVDHGVWGGLSATERRAMREAQARAAAAGSIR